MKVCRLPHASISDTKDSISKIVPNHKSITRIIVHVGSNDILRDQLIVIQAFKELLITKRTWNTNFYQWPATSKGKLCIFSTIQSQHLASKDLFFSWAWTLLTISICFGIAENSSDQIAQNSAGLGPTSWLTNITFVSAMQPFPHRPWIYSLISAL